MAEATSITATTVLKSPSAPLLPLSPERVNANSSMGPMQSPSLPNFSFATDNAGSPLGKVKHHQHHRGSSDVQGMVARFNSLDIKDHAELRKKDEARLHRAQIAREEAESLLAKSRETQRQLQKSFDESQERERRVVKRLDVVMEDLHSSKATHAHAQSLYEKEIRRARKEAFKSSSAVVKLQEELKATRNAFRVALSDLEMEKRKGGAKDQEAFTAQYELIAVREELAKVKARVAVVEEERDALKSNLKEEEIVRVAAAGKVALPVQDDDSEFASPKKSNMHASMAAAHHQEAARAKHDLDNLREELVHSRRLQQKLEDQLDFMKMECQFGCCSCRIAEVKGKKFKHDDSLAEDILLIRPVSRTPPPAYDEMQLDLELPAEPASKVEESFVSTEPNEAEMYSTALEEESARPRSRSRTASRAASKATTPAPDSTSNHLQNDDIVITIPATPKSTTNHPPIVAEQVTSNKAEQDVAPTPLSAPWPTLEPSTNTRITTDPYDEVDDEAEADYEPSPTPSPIKSTNPHAVCRTITTTTTIPLHLDSSPMKPPEVFTPQFTSTPIIPFDANAQTIQNPSQDENSNFNTPTWPAAANDLTHADAPLTAPANANTNGEKEQPNISPPSTLTREEAIAQLRARRGRARSQAASSNASTNTSSSTHNSGSAAATAGATPKRSASHGQALSGRRERERGADAGSRSASANEVRRGGQTPKVRK